MELVILHTNDTHGQLTPVADLAGRSLGGYARRATFVRQQREQHPDLLLLDAGDLYQGSRYWHAFRGEADIELMNLLGYDAAALGNHDTDAGLEVLSARIREARFPVMCANMRFPNSHPLCDLWKPYHVVEVNGARVAIFSMLIDAMELYPAAFRESVEVRPYVDVASELVPHLRRQADAVILLSHLGHTDDVRLAEHVTGIDLIIGGHTHTGLREAFMINGTPLVRGIVGGPVVGKTVLSLNGGSRATVSEYDLHELNGNLPEDPQVLDVLERWNTHLPPEEVIGRLAYPIDTRSTTKNFAESAAGNLYVDALKAYYGASVDATLVHMGTIRGERVFPAGPFTNHDLAEYHPFDNPPFLMDLTAPELKFVLERGVHELPEGRGAFLSIAGIRIEVDISRQPQVIDRDHARVITPGQRVVAASQHGQPIDFTDESRVFRVVMDGYLGRGGLGYFVAKTARRKVQADTGGQAIIRWYFKRHGPVDPRVDGRIIVRGRWHG